MRREKEEKYEEMEFKEPYQGEILKFKVVPIESLSVISHQRKPSNYHVKHLVSSIERVGFLVPLIVVQKNDKYLILDGQHRLLAAQKLDLKELPVVIAPPKIAQLMMNLNIEKELNIREKSYVALNIYKEYLEKNPKILESDPLLADSIEKVFYVTLGIGYQKQERLRGGAFESVLKKCDFFLEKKLKDAFEIREKRAERIIEANNLVTSIAQKLKEMEKWHPYIYQQIISFANPYKRKREPTDFDELFSTLIENLKKADENPELILKEKLED
jgi:ParB family chromosome partitioning protein